MRCIDPESELDAIFTSSGQKFRPLKKHYLQQTLIVPRTKSSYVVKTICLGLNNETKGNSFPPKPDQRASDFQLSVAPHTTTVEF